ncbi:MAG: 23S rRNA (uracil(1939)-C(5))-methyltransferase RlmD [bacterium]
MAKKRYKRKQRLPEEAFEATIESLSQEGRGVAHPDGKVVFIDGALAGEKVLFKYSARQRRHDEGYVVEVLEPSSLRVDPKCAHYELCGGCSLQHMDADAQINAKQTSMLEGLKHIGGVQPAEVLPPLRGPLWGYRRKARLGCKDVPAKGRVLVGFREKRGSFLADILRCEVLHEKIGAQLEALSELLGGLSIKNRIPQLEVAVHDNATAMVVRHLEPLNDGDKEKLIDFAETHDLQLYQQPKGPSTVAPLRVSVDSLYYEHPDYNVKVDVGPLDFFQVNTDINRQMVKRAIEHLDLSFEHKVLDLYCGLGNFTLPIARHVKEVVGVEGDKPMVERARKNALANGLENTRYYVCNLMEEVKDEPWMNEHWDRVLLDPPRSGAQEVIRALGPMGVPKIVYVSCHPGTLARDVGILVNEFGYTLTHAGVMDMFPHTAHVESFAVFTKA